MPSYSTQWEESCSIFTAPAWHLKDMVLLQHSAALMNEILRSFFYSLFDIYILQILNYFEHEYLFESII